MALPEYKKTRTIQSTYKYFTMEVGDTTLIARQRQTKNVTLALNILLMIFFKFIGSKDGLQQLVLLIHK